MKKLHFLIIGGLVGFILGILLGYSQSFYTSGGPISYVFFDLPARIVITLTPKIDPGLVVSLITGENIIILGLLWLGAISLINICFGVILGWLSWKILELNESKKRNSHHSHT